MKFKIILACVVLIAAAGAVVARANSPSIHEKHPKHTATVYKTPTCGCCANYANYLRTKNYDVEVIDLSQKELTEKKRKLGVPATLDSCHTTVAKTGSKTYFIEGHIPFEANHKLLSEKPDIKGIGMPGMPSASPGMPGNKTEPFSISQVANNGQVASYLTL